MGFCYHYLNLNPHLYIGKVSDLTSVPVMCHSSTFSLCECPSSLLSVAVGLGDHVCGMWLFHSCSAGGHCLQLEDSLKMSLFGCALLYDTVYIAPMISLPQ